MFQSARIKLTLWYLLIIMTISIMFSAVIYRVLVSEIDRFERAQRFRIERRLLNREFVPPNDLHMMSGSVLLANPELIEETKHRILLMLISVNTGIFVVAGGIGFLLAGRTLHPIQEMVQEQHRFISDASHELKTPLTSLRSAFEVYLRSKNQTPREAKHLIKDSLSDVNRLQALSESLLMLAQYQLPNGLTKFTSIPVTEVVKNAIHKVTPLAKEKNITLRIDPTEGVVYGNHYALSDLFVILLDNAIKYSPAGKTVTVSFRREDGNMLCSVSDEGIGIAAKDLPHVFERFYRTDSARSKAGAGGYGLGLSIAKKIAESHRGSIRVRSTLNKGSTFTVLLPSRSGSRITQITSDERASGSADS